MYSCSLTLLSLLPSWVRIQLTIFVSYRRVIIRETPKEVSEYIADYIISMP